LFHPGEVIQVAIAASIVHFFALRASQRKQISGVPPEPDQFSATEADPLDGSCS